MLGQAVDHKRLIIALDQRLHIIDKFLCHIIALLVDPVSGNKLFVVGDAVYIVDTGSRVFNS